MSINRNNTNKENFDFIGTSTEENENRRVDSQKFVPAWKQEVRDERGRRRFHGAFTGGFSAGYFNTVGSKEGWKPSETATREAFQKAAARKPEDFMDEEDLEDIRQSKETVAIFDTDDSSQDAQRRALASLPNALGFAPDSLIDLFIEQPKETIGVTILKEMGWKPGFGIGPRKLQDNPLDVYGCDNLTFSQAKKKIMIPPADVPLVDFDSLNSNRGLNLEVDAKSVQMETVKSNLDHYRSFAQSVETSIQDPYDKSENRTYSSTVVDLDDDEDRIVLQRKKRRPPPPNAFVVPSISHNLSIIHKLVCHDGRPPLTSFILASVAYQESWTPPPVVPANFVPIHKFNNTLTPPTALPTHSIPSEARGQMLGEAQAQRSIFEFLSGSSKERIAEFSRVAKTPSIKTTVSVADSELNLQLVLQHAMLDVTSAQAALRGFIPFGDNPAKQNRYRQLLQFFSKEIKTPPSWPEEATIDFKIQEIKDFQKAAQLFRPLSQVMASKFVSASEVTVETQTQFSPGLTMVPAKTPSIPVQPQPEPAPNTPTDFGMFGLLTRSVDTFTPSRLLCKRFGVAEPHPEVKQGSENPASNSRPPVNYQSTTLAAKKPALDPSNFMSHFAKNQNDDEVLPVPDSPKEREEPPRPPTSLFLAVFGSTSDSE